MPVPYAEEAGSPKDSFSESGSLVAVRRLRCLWSDRYALLVQIGNNGGEDYPHYPNIGCLARGAAIDPAPGKGDEYALGMAKYEHALITVHYSTDAPTYFGSHFVTEEFQPAGENRRMDPTELRWETVGGKELTVHEAPPYLHGMFDYVLTFHDLLTIPPAALTMNVSNSVQMTAFIFPLTFAVETLRHMRPLLSHTVGLGIMDRFRLTYRWTYNPKTWSKFQKSNGEWEVVFNTDGTQLKPYPPFDMQAMYPS